MKKLSLLVASFLASVMVLVAVLFSTTASAQVGMASWYGPGFHGRLTASGQRYNQYAPTVAHRKLPFGTKIKVTNLRNGKSVIATVTDRGPYSGGRILDVSKGLAIQLGMIKSGVAKVQITVLSTPKTKFKYPLKTKVKSKRKVRRS